MYIVSKIKDYYDCMQYQMEYDPKIVYARKYQYIKNPLNKNDFSILSSAPNYFMFDVCVFFCGKAYIGYRKYNPYPEDINCSEKDDHFIWLSSESTEKDILLRKDEHSKSYPKWGSRYSYHPYEKGMKGKIFDFLNKDFTELHRSVGTPIILFSDSEEGSVKINNYKIFSSRNYDNGESDNNTYYNGHWFKDAILKDYNFGSVMEPFIAWQTLEQFYDNTFSNKPEMVELSDEDKAAKHGYDEFSFRRQNHPAKPRKRKKKKAKC